MKARMSFSQFLSSRFTPCVFCFPSDVVRLQFPDYKEQIESQWEEIQANSKFHIRLLFPGSLPTFSDVEENLCDLRKLQPNSTPYDFLNIEPRISRRSELESIAVLRQRLFEIDFMPFYLWCDIPISLLTIATGDEQPALPLNVMPSWARKMLSTLKANLLRFPPKDLASSLQRLHSDILPERLKEAQKTVIASYQSYWKGWKQNVQGFLGSPIEPTSGIISLKFYADLKLVERKHEEAATLYQRLIDVTPPNNGPFLAQVHFLRAANDVVSRQLTQNTIRALSTAIQIAQQNNYPILFHQCVLSDFWVRVHLSVSTRTSLIQIAFSKDTSKYTTLDRPFIFEQIAALSTKRRSARMLTVAAESFKTIECREHSVRCLWRAFNIVKHERWSLISQQIMEQICQSMLTTNFNLSDQLGELMQSRVICHPEILYNMMQVFSSEKYYRCGFVRARIYNFESKGFPSSRPRGFKGNSWFMTGERLFGAFTRGKFFSKSQLEKFECAIGTTVNVKVCVTSTLKNFPFTNIQLRIDGEGKAKTTSCTINSPRSNVIDLSFTPTSPGNIKISGIIFVWGGKVNLSVPFMDNMLLFQVYEVAPQLSTTIIGNVKKKLAVGETTSFDIRLLNGSLPLKFLSMLVITGIPTELYEPKTDDIFGQYILSPLKENEETTLKLAVHADKVGIFNLLLLISYWSTDPPPRYEYLSIDFEVYKPKLVLHESENRFHISCPKNYLPLGFTAPNFNASLYTDKIEGRKASFNFVSRLNNNKEYSFIDLPDYVKSYQKNDSLNFWFRDGVSYVEYPLSSINFPMAISIKKNGEMIYLVIQNIYKRQLTDVKIYIVSPEKLSFLISGKFLLLIDKMEPDQTAEMKFSFVRLLKEPNPQILIACDQFGLINVCNIDFD